LHTFDFAVLELDSWQLQGFGSLKISPQIAVFTTFFQDHMNYYKNDMKKYFTDKANIFKFQKKDQKKNNVFVLGKQVVPFLKKYLPKLNLEKSRFDLKGAQRSNLDFSKFNFLISKEKLPRDWKINLLGAHNQYNASLAVEVARLLGINDIEIKKALESFEPIPGRLEFLREFNGIKIFNDNN
jgi:UDP-N-acetylmuramoylalanine--D-glutamate ligase